MLRLAAAAFLLLATPAFAIDFQPNDQGQIEFTTPTNNIGCIYTPEGGTSTYYPTGGGPELQCDRVEPAYVRAVLGPKGSATIITNVGDASCCSTVQVFPYGETWEMGPFMCASDTSGLTCARGPHGFKMSKKGVKKF